MAAKELLLTDSEISENIEGKTDSEQLDYLLGLLLNITKVFCAHPSCNLEYEKLLEAYKRMVGLAESNILQLLEPQGHS